MRYFPATDIMKYVYCGILPGSVSDILPAVMPRSVVTKHHCWWLGGGKGGVDPDTVCSVTFRFETAKYTIPPLVGEFSKLLRHVCPSVSMDQLGPKWKNFNTFGVRLFVGDQWGKFKLHYNLTTITGTSHEDRYIFLSYLAQFFLKRGMFQTKVVEKIKTHILCSVFFFRKSCRL
jgi:hypothetical protein